jgi:LDH2 family malate/lactate/ureidoglycolate dehydrogenase
MQSYRPETVAQQIQSILTGFGLPAQQQTKVVDGMLYADLRGIDSHGIALLPLYQRWLAEGAVNIEGQPSVTSNDGASITIDGGGNLGFLSASLAAEQAIKLAQDKGVAAVTVSRSHHFGAAGFYAHQIASAGLMAFVTTSTKVVCVVPPGGKDPVLGTNPLAYGVPRTGAVPIVFDIATSTAAGNRIRVFKYQNKPVPEGWIVDGEGKPVTDAARAEDIVYGRERGGITPLGSTLLLGSHKGYGLSLMTHFFAGCLAGGSFSGRSRLDEDKRNTPLGQDNIGHFFLALDPARFGGGAGFAASVQEVVDSLHATEPVDPDCPVMLPGEIEQRVMQARERDGIPLADALVEQIVQLAHTLGVANVLRP